MRDRRAHEPPQSHARGNPAKDEVGQPFQAREHKTGVRDVKIQINVEIADPNVQGGSVKTKEESGAGAQPVERERVWETADKKEIWVEVERGGL